MLWYPFDLCTAHRLKSGFLQLAGRGEGDMRGHDHLFPERDNADNSSVCLDVRGNSKISWNLHSRLPSATGKGLSSIRNIITRGNRILNAPITNWRRKYNSVADYSLSDFMCKHGNGYKTNELAAHPGKMVNGAKQSCSPKAGQSFYFASAINHDGGGR